LEFELDDIESNDVDEIESYGLSYFNEKGVPSVSDKEFIIDYPESNTSVIIPEENRITSITEEKVKILTKKEMIILENNKTLVTFCPINFVTSIKGLNKYMVNIYYNETKFNDVVQNDYVHYLIEWGNGEKTENEGPIPSNISYEYNEEGRYLLTITLTDRNGLKFVYQWNQTIDLTPNQIAVLWADENKETIAVSSAGTIGGLSILGFILTETGKYKLLALLAFSFPLFTRINKDDVLDHFVRGEIYGYIKANPGVHYNQIIQDLEIKNGSLSYHLHIMEKSNIIKSRIEGYRYRAFYPTDMKFPDIERNRLTELQLNIMDIIRKNKGINQKEISKRLNEKHQTISYNIKILYQAGLIDVNKKGRKTSCYINKDVNINLS
jgi:predicted transcriptional regulator